MSELTLEEARAKLVEFWGPWLEPIQESPDAIYERRRCHGIVEAFFRNDEEPTRDTLMKISAAIQRGL